jgi:hypothetical protein
VLLGQAWPVDAADEYCSERLPVTLSFASFDPGDSFRYSLKLIRGIFARRLTVWQPSKNVRLRMESQITRVSPHRLPYIFIACDYIHIERLV